MLDIRKIRKEKKLSQTDFGLQMGYTHSYISNIENGKEPITDNFLDKLHDAYQVEVEKFKSYNRKKETIDDGFKDKYYELLERYNKLSDKLTECMEDKALIVKQKKSPYNVDYSVNEPEPKKLSRKK